MGYACPVCDVPQRDGKHLANHLAFTALLRHEDHETWLDDHVDDWSEMNAPELADHVVDHADEHDFESVFEDTTDDHDHAHEHAGHGGGGSPAIRQEGNLDGEAQQVLREAQELTQQMMEGDGEDADESTPSDDVAVDDTDDTDDAEE
ncbi:hypothetical protein SAMN04487950_0079 [Halogranum rubrum]|uniref:Uncharacterized protein n=1 Tax=Halogranum rubrum TaxID=553466 RepID=A0A1I4AUF5_9EURY|nr:DUF5810 domain-containing protein [Halogranum rubrum]SFK59349.1 hypothetical protein SAMN04487950_0079 [Halogranum rubrum]